MGPMWHGCWLARLSLCYFVLMATIQLLDGSWKQHNPTEQKSFKIHQNSSKYTKKSKVDGTLPMLFFDFYKILTKHGHDWTRFQRAMSSEDPKWCTPGGFMTINPQRTTKLHGKRVWDNPWCDCLDLNDIHYWHLRIFYHSVTYQTVSTNYHTYRTCFKGLPNLRRCTPPPLDQWILQQLQHFHLTTGRVGNSNTDDRQFLPEESWDQNWWFGDPKKKLQKKHIQTDPL